MTVVKAHMHLLMRLIIIRYLPYCMQNTEKLKRANVALAVHSVHGRFLHQIASCSINFLYSYINESRKRRRRQLDLSQYRWTPMTLPSPTPLCRLLFARLPISRCNLHFLSGEPQETIFSAFNSVVMNTRWTRRQRLHFSFSLNEWKTLWPTVVETRGAKSEFSSVQFLQSHCNHQLC